MIKPEYAALSPGGFPDKALFLLERKSAVVLSNGIFTRRLTKKVKVPYSFSLNSFLLI
ncbi:MAG: hypothetical protein IT214_14060 [Chitinophagaceae bacterium]|jgi:hypothetical protein|nr:hypothetical protein [Chitinophagaceae bacterium]